MRTKKQEQEEQKPPLRQRRERKKPANQQKRKQPQALQIINQLAAEYQREHPKASRRAAVKAAGVEYRKRYKKK
jgi:hypothetical protein